MEELARGRAVTPFMVLLTALEAVLSRYDAEGRSDFAIGTPIAGRRDVAVEGLIGFFVNTLVLRAGLGGDPTFFEALARCRSTTLEAFDHQDVPFEHLVNELAPERDASRTPLFQVLLNFGETAPRLCGLPGLTLSPVDVPVRSSKFDLGFTFHPPDTEAANSAASASRLEVLRRSELFDTTTVERLSRHLETLLEAALRAPDLRLSDLPLLCVAQRHQVEVELAVGPAADTVPFAPRQTLAQAFEAQSARTPGAWAVECGTDRLTFRQLDERASRLGRPSAAPGRGPRGPGRLVRRALGRHGCGPARHPQGRRCVRSP